MIATPVQCDVDGIPKRSHYVRVPIAIGRSNDLGNRRAAMGARKARDKCRRVRLNAWLGVMIRDESKSANDLIRPQQQRLGNSKP